MSNANKKIREIVRNKNKDRTFDINRIDDYYKKKLKDAFNHEEITNTIRTALATGNWGKDKNTGEVAKTGVSQVLKRDTSLFATLSHLRRVNAPIKSSTKIATPRLLHSTHFGMICPAETPEGGKIGIVKNLAVIYNKNQIILFFQILINKYIYIDLIK
jgi:DNA-directed RNA polymerase II subunit RPB2